VTRSEIILSARRVTDRPYPEIECLYYPAAGRAGHSAKRFRNQPRRFLSHMPWRNQIRRTDPDGKSRGFPGSASYFVRIWARDSRCVPIRGCNSSLQIIASGCVFESGQATATRASDIALGLCGMVYISEGWRATKARLFCSTADAFSEPPEPRRIAASEQNLSEMQNLPGKSDIGPADVSKLRRCLFASLGQPLQLHLADSATR
jgi:hypothetical protein